MKIELDKISERAPGDTGDFIKLDLGRCTGCGRCAMVCVVNLWRMRGGVANLRDDYKQVCLECAACYSVCDPRAIDFSYPAGGTGVVYLNG